MAKELSTEIYFIIDGARLEAQACLLAPTLKANMSKSQKAVAYLHQDYRAALDPLTVEVLERAGIETRDIPGRTGAHGPWAAPYPHGNKILAATDHRHCDITVFLDTDVILAEPVDFAGELGKAQIAACVSDYAPSAGSDEDWAHFYEAFDLPPHEERVQYNAGRRIVSFPYFNAGVVIWRERDAKGKPTHIGRDWLTTALSFEQRVTRPYDRTNIDQFTLPILGYLRGKPVKTLDQRLNFNIESFGQGQGHRQSIAHYHRLGILWAHETHGRYALETFTALMGMDATERFLEAFSAHAKRKRMKRHLSAIAIGASAAAAC